MVNRRLTRRKFPQFLWVALLVIVISFFWSVFGGEIFSGMVVDEERPRIIIGNSKIELKKGDVVGVQVDRVIRDISWEGSPYDERVSIEKIPEKKEDFVPYMEGKRAQEMVSWAGVEILPLTPARAKLKEEGLYWPPEPYYAFDGIGEFSFLVEPTKVEYGTVFLPEDVFEEADIILPDTHGFNMVAEKAYLHKDQLHTVMACMDFESKAEAALFLATEGMNIYAPCDRFAGMLMNYKEKYNVSGTIIGSAPMKKSRSGVVIGDRPLAVYLDEVVVVQYTQERYPHQYCDTPWRYFSYLLEELDIEIEVVKVTANIGEASKVVEKAREENSNVIGVRVKDEDDYSAVAEWLKEDNARRAILFHSVAFDSGVKLFEKFPRQTTFGDLQPEIIR